MRRPRPLHALTLLACLAAAPAAAQEEPRRDASPDPTEAPAPEEEGTSAAEEGASAEEDSEAPPERYGGGGGFDGDAMTRRVVGMLEEELDLDDGQVDRVTVIMQGATQQIFERMGEAWAQGDGGRPDFERMRSVMEDVRIEIAEKITAVLTPAQQREFEALVDQFDRRTQRWDQRRRASEDPTRYFDPPPLRKRVLLARAERALFLGPDETQAVMPFVEDVLDKRIALREGLEARRRDLRVAAEDDASRDELQDRLEELRAAEEFQRLELLAAEQRLRELLTLEQEARFVAMGILD